MNDKLLRGAFAGFLASITQMLYGILVVLIGLAKHRYLDYSQAIVLGSPHSDVYSQIVGFTGHLIFDSVLGILFIYFVPKGEEHHPYIKAILFGLLAWFFVDAAGVTAFKVPVFIFRPSSEAFSTLIGGIVFGFSLSFFLKLLKKFPSL